MTEPVDPPEPPEDDEVRRLLRGLPEVSPPEGFFDDLIRRRRRNARRLVLAGLALAVVAGGLVVAKTSGITGEVELVLGDLADRHATVVAIDVAQLRGQVDGDDLPAPYQAPRRLGGLEREMAVRHPDDVVQVMYARDGEVVSVFEAAGHLADDLGRELDRMEMSDAPAWRSDEGLVVVRRDDVVYVLAGTLDDDELVEVVEDLPDARPMGLGRRIRDAMDELVGAFGFR